MAKVRHSLAWITLQENLRGILITILVVGVCAMAIGIPIARQSSPIVNVERLTGTVVNATGRGFSYLYGIRLDKNDRLVFVYGDARAPRAIGSKVSVERQHRRNNAQTYRLLRQ